MSSTLVITPCSSMNATESGISVFFIHMQGVESSSKMNSIPTFEAMAVRYMRPWERLPKSAATSAWIRCMPAWSCTTGNDWAPAVPTARARARARIGRINEKGREVPAFSDLSSELLLVHRRLLVHRGLLVGRLLLVGLLLVGRLFLAVLLVHLAACGFLVRLAAFVLRERGEARGREHCRDQDCYELLHVIPFSGGYGKTGLKERSPSPITREADERLTQSEVVVNQPDSHEEGRL